MAKAEIKDAQGNVIVSAFTTAHGGVRFSKPGTGLVKEVDVPAEYVTYLKNQLGVDTTPKEPSRFEQATAPEQAATVQPSEPPTLDGDVLNEAPLSAADFDDTVAEVQGQGQVIAPPEPAPTQIEVSSPEPLPEPQNVEQPIPYIVQANAMGGGVEYPRGTAHAPGSTLMLTMSEAAQFAPGLIIPATQGTPTQAPKETRKQMHERNFAFGQESVDAASYNRMVQFGLDLLDEIEDLAKRLAEVHELQAQPQPETDIDMVSIHSVPLEDLARAMFERFGIYTIFLNRFPENNEISPIHGEPMTSYDRGVAYQAARRAFTQGRLKKIDYEKIKEKRENANTQSRAIRHGYTHPSAPMTEKQHAQQNTFDYRTSVRGANENPNGMRSTYHPEEAEPIAEPRLGGQPIIRPNW